MLNLNAYLQNKKKQVQSSFMILTPSNMPVQERKGAKIEGKGMVANLKCVAGGMKSSTK